MILPPITLRIAEAQSKDAGRAIARIDPKAFSKIEADTGDVVKLKRGLNQHKTAERRFCVLNTALSRYDVDCTECSRSSVIDALRAG